MLKNIKKTLSHSVIYSFGNFATKLIGVILLPLYTKHITVSEYGILGILEITIMILTQVLILGQPNAFLRFYDLDEYKEKRKITLFTISIFLLSIIVVVNIFSQYFASNLAAYFSKPLEFTIYFRLCFAIISLRIFNILFLSVLRVQEKSTYYAIANILKISIILGLICFAFYIIGINLAI